MWRRPFHSNSEACVALFVNVVTPYVPFFITDKPPWLLKIHTEYVPLNSERWTYMQSSLGLPCNRSSIQAFAWMCKQSTHYEGDVGTHNSPVAGHCHLEFFQNILHWVQRSEDKTVNKCRWIELLGQRTVIRIMGILQTHWAACIYSLLFSPLWSTCEHPIVLCRGCGGGS